MSAAARARLFRLAGALSPPGARLRRLAGQRWTAISFGDLAQAPDWLALPVADRARLARLGALAALAPALARSIDGRWLGRLAAEVGPDDLDWAIGLGARAPAEPADDWRTRPLDELGPALLAAALAPALGARLGPPVLPCPAEAARRAVGLAQARMLAA